MTPTEDAKFKAYHELDAEIRAYGNGMFLTVTHQSGADPKTQFQLILATSQYREHWFHGSQTKYTISIRFYMAEVEACRAAWIGLRDVDFKKVQKWETPWWASGLAWNG